MPDLTGNVFAHDGERAAPRSSSYQAQNCYHVVANKPIVFLLIESIIYKHLMVAKKSELVHAAYYNGPQLHVYQYLLFESTHKFRNVR